jgi:RNA polymerase sigma-70 factor (ECF subfamily)
VFEQYAGYVLALLPRLGVPASDVDDVAQEVFLVIHRSLASFEGRSSLKTWICGICLRKAREQRRHASRRSARHVPLAVEPAVASQVEAQLQDAEHAALFEQGLRQLSLEQRTVFVLYEVEELSMVEVAQAAGCPRFTAYTRLHSARRKMRAFFERARAQGRFS